MSALENDQCVTLKKKGPVRGVKEKIVYSFHTYFFFLTQWCDEQLKCPLRR